MTIAHRCSIRFLNFLHQTRFYHLRNSTFNEVNIKLIDQSLDQKLFGRSENYVNLDNEQKEKIILNLKNHGITIGPPTASRAIAFDIPDFEDNAKNIIDHMEMIAHKQCSSYKAQVDEILKICQSPPPLPDTWNFASGWTKYNKDGFVKVAAPAEDCMVFDVEVIVPESPEACLAVALTKDGWYSWCSPKLVDPDCPSINVCLVPLYECKASRERKKVVIGHFVSFDRARILDEYDSQATGIRFLDTMALHICIGGLTTYQRSIKRMFTKKNFDNKVWEEFVSHQSQGMGKSNDSNDNNVDLNWINQSSMNNLVDLYETYLNRSAKQTKAKRDIFVKGSSAEVRSEFQELTKYCALDVLMTMELFHELWPTFLERFPHPVTLAGMLEMGSMYLPINKDWEIFQSRTANVFQQYQKENLQFLASLAKEALQLAEGEKYRDDLWLWDLDWQVPKPRKSIPPELTGLPQWYLDLFPRPLVSAYAIGPTLLTPSRRLAPKLLRLMWDGIPLHHDQQLKWGYLIPGLNPSSASDPQFFTTLEEIKSHIPVTTTTASAPKNREFPMKQLTLFWQNKLHNSLLGLCSYFAAEEENGKKTKSADIRMFEEMSRLLDHLPLEEDARKKLNENVRALKQFLSSSSSSSKMSSKKGYQKESIAHIMDKGKQFIKQPKSRSGICETVDPHIATCWFSYLPHPNGIGNSVGSPLSKAFRREIQDGRLSSQLGDSATRLLHKHIACSFWQSYFSRIKSQVFYFIDGDHLSTSCSSHAESGAILPTVISAGTVTRRAVEPLWLTASNAEADRIGSEVKAMVRSPKGYCFVGADVDSQEMWIAAILGDSKYGIHGGSPYGWMVLQGSKQEGTDLHTRSAQKIGISRNQAKVFNYSRLYGSGVEHSKQLLMTYNAQMPADEATSKARTLLESTKGKRNKMGAWQGGTESDVFNQIERIANLSLPKTPFLSCAISRFLAPTAVQNDFATSRMNWVVQSSAVDYLHCLLVCMRWLIEKWDLHDTRLCISIHDEVRYITSEPNRYRVALALQIANLFTRAFFSAKLGLKSLPESVAFFSAVEVDRCLRKDANDDCITPSNPGGLKKDYGIPAGETLKIRDILKHNGI